MSASKSFQTQQNFVPYRPISPKLTTHTPTSGNSNQSQPYMSLQQRTKQNSQVQTDHFATIRHQNNLLRQENKALKRQLNLIKGQSLLNQQTSGFDHNHKHEVNDLRQTIKKQAGEIKQLKTRLQVVSKQCKMYEQIIDKMQGKINKLTQQNKLLQHKIKQLKSNQNSERQEKNEQLSKSLKQKQKFLQMIQKVNEITNHYIQLEQKVEQSDKEWEMWKQKWGKQKSYYLNRIHDLQSLMGIGMESKQFYKKRF